MTSTLRTVPALLVLFSLAAILSPLVMAGNLADTYRVEVLQEPAPGEGLSPDTAKLLAPTGVRVLRGETRVVCDIWLCKEWALLGFDAPNDVLYPFRSGQLIGVARFARRSGDFRDQPVDGGLYTLRFALQPIDGDHAGTSATRDFLLLVKAEDDSSPDDVGYDRLMELSAAAVGTNHPGMFAMKKATEDPAAPSIRHDEENDWWLVRLQSVAKAAAKTRDLTFDVVLIGHAKE